jgi:hypothetical protein
MFFSAGSYHIVKISPIWIMAKCVKKTLKSLIVLLFSWQLRPYKGLIRQNIIILYFKRSFLQGKNGIIKTTRQDTGHCGIKRTEICNGSVMGGGGNI